MSAPLVVEGTIDEVETKLLAIQDIIDKRKVAGWSLFQKGEKWLYVTRPDLGEVCPVCDPFHGRELDGEEVTQLFPQRELVSQRSLIGEYIASPRTHQTQDAINQQIVGPCHCDIVLQNAAEVMEMRLHEDKLTVV